jgi:hypothetical protein
MMSEPQLRVWRKSTFQRGVISVGIVSSVVIQPNVNRIGLIVIPGVSNVFLRPGGGAAVAGQDFTILAAGGRQLFHSDDYGPLVSAGWRGIASGALPVDVVIYELFSTAG